jgi:hypothetical protein
VTEATIGSGGNGPGFDFYGGATVILNPQGAAVRGPKIRNRRRAPRRQREFIISDGARFFGGTPGDTRIPESKVAAIHDDAPQF